MRARKIELNTPPRVLVIHGTAYGAGTLKIGGVSKYARLYGPWDIRLVQGGWWDAAPKHISDVRKYDGIIAGPHMLYLDDVMKSARCPVVLIDPMDIMTGGNSYYSKFPRVVDDAAALGKMAADYYLSKVAGGRGLMHFAYVGMQNPIGWSVRRGKAFVQELAAKEIECEVFVPDKNSKDESDGASLSKWLFKLPKPVAVFAASDPRARQVAGLCLESGLRIPDDVAILGVDDDRLICAGGIPSLSSVKNDYEGAGFAAARMLDDMMHGQKIAETEFRYGPTGVTERESTDFYALSLPPVVRKIREIIKFNARSTSSVADILQGVKASRRTAETEFKAATGHSILEEMHAEKLAIAERLLEETDIPLNMISQQSGFGTDRALQGLFRKTHGMTMKDYRNEKRSARN